MTTKPTLATSFAANHVVTSTEWNTNVLQLGNYAEEVLAGTNSDKIPGTALASPLTMPGTVFFANDSSFSAQIVSSNPHIMLNESVGAYLKYDRSAKQLVLAIDSLTALNIDANGKMIGKGFYESAETSITTGSTATVSHGLASRPRFVSLFASSGSGANSGKAIGGYPAYDDGLANQIKIYSTTTTQMSARNGFGATYYVVFAAML